MTSPRRRRPPAEPAPPLLTLADLQVHLPGIDETKGEAMIRGAIGIAGAVAPCILRPDFPAEKADAAREIILSAIVRRHDQGAGSLMMMQADIFAARFDNRTPRTAGGYFYKDELKSLAALCRRGKGAYSINTAPGAGIPPQWWEGTE